MYIENVSVKDIPPISKSISLDCDERVNLFIGPNASGKSTLLRVMDYAYCPNEEHLLSGTITYETVIKENLITSDIESSTARLEERFGSDAPACILVPSNDWPHRDLTVANLHIKLPIWNKVPLLYIPSTRVNLPLDATEVLNMNPFSNVEIEEGQARIPFSFGLDSTADPFIFDGGHLKKDISKYWLIEQHIHQSQERIGKALHIGYLCAKKICSEVFSGYSSHPYVEIIDDGDYKGEMSAHPYMGIETSDDIAGAFLYLGELSSGTQGTLLWIYALALKIAHHYKWRENWEEEPAILLIDEIENHLHPTWQRRVIPTLLEQFPKLQIFATTHSPFVVAGLKAGQVHLLDRGKGGVVTTASNTEDIVGWTIDEVLRNIMGVNDPTDVETARAAVKLRKLRSQEPLPDEQAEEQRQRRMWELRQKVNRELLTGGPVAAQREEFEQQFAEALQRYQKRQSLDQDSG